MRALIDGDIILYEIGFAAQKKIDGEIIPSPVDEVNQMVDNKIKEICAAVYATEPPTIYITGVGNFRYDIAKQREYKGNRKQIKPFHYKYIKSYLQAQWGAIVVDGMEADDALCIEQTSRLRFKDTIICSRDKDLKQCPGYHYSWECGKQGSWGPGWVDELGTLVLKGPKKLIGTGMLFFYSQLLTGDSTDTYDGLPGCGPIGAFKILEGKTTAKEMYDAVLGAYRVRFGDSAECVLEEQAHLAWMIREVNDDGSILHWKAPTDKTGGEGGVEEDGSGMVEGELSCGESSGSVYGEGGDTGQMDW